MHSPFSSQSFTSPLVQGGGINELHNIPNKEVTEDSASLRKDYPSNEQFEDPNNQDMELTCTFMHPKDQQCIKEEDFTIYEDQSSSIPPQPDNPPNVQHVSSGVNTAVDMSLDLSCFSSPKAPVDVIHTRVVELKDESTEWHSSNMPLTCSKSDSTMSFTCADPLQSPPTQGNVSSADSNMSLTCMNNQGVSAAVPQHDDKSQSSETCTSPLPQRDVKSQSTGVHTETQQRCVCTESSRVENTCKISDVMPLPPQDKSASSSQSYSMWAIDSHEHSNAVKEGNEEETGAELPDLQFPSMSIVPPLTVSVVDRKAVEAGSHWEPHTAKESIIVGKPPVKSCIPRLGLTRQSHGRMKQSRQQRRLALPHSLSSTKLSSLIHNSITASTLQHSLNAVVTGNTSNGAMNQSTGSKKNPSASGTNLHEDNEASLVSIQDKSATSVGQQQNKTPSLLDQQQNKAAKLSDQQQNETATVVGGQQNETVTSLGQYHYETAKSVGQQQQHGPVQMQSDSLHAPVLDRSEQMQNNSLHAPVLDRSEQMQNNSLHAPVLDKSEQMQNNSLHAPVLDRSKQMQNNSLHAPALDKSEQMQNNSLHAPVLDRSEQMQNNSLHAPVLDRSEQMQNNSLHAPVLDRSEQMQNNSLHAPVPDRSKQMQNNSLHAPVLDRSEQMQNNSLHAPVLDRSEQMQNNSLHVSCSDTSSVPNIVVCDKAHTNSTASLSADGDTRSVTSIREFADSVPSLDVTADEPPKVQTSIRKKLRGSLNRTYDISPESSNLLPVASEGTDNESLHRPLANQHPDNDGFDMLSKNGQFIQQDEEISLVASSTCSEDDSKRELDMSQEEVGGCNQTANPRKVDESKLSLICADDLPALKNSTMTATNRRSPVQKSRDSQLVCPEDKEANTTDTAVDMEEQTLPCISSVKQQKTVSCAGVKNTGSLFGSNFLSPVSRRRSGRSLPSTPGSEFQSFVLTPNTTVALKDDSEEDSEESFKPYEHLTMETAPEYFGISRDQINSLTKLECLGRLVLFTDPPYMHTYVCSFTTSYILCTYILVVHIHTYYLDFYICSYLEYNMYMSI